MKGDDIRQELEAQGAQRLALEVMFSALLSALQRNGALSNAALVGLFEEAQDTLTAGALNLGAKAPAEFITRAMKIVEEVRSHFGLAET